MYESHYYEKIIDIVTDDYRIGKLDGEIKKRLCLFLYTYLRYCSEVLVIYLCRLPPDFISEQPLLFICALIQLSVKFFEDSFVTNETMCKYFSLDLQSLNKMEWSIYMSLDFNLYIFLEQLENIKNYIASY